MPSKESVGIVATIGLVIALTLGAYKHESTKYLSGTWLRSSAEGFLPDVVKVDIAGGRFWLDYPTPNESETIIVPLDRAEHRWPMPFGSYGFEGGAYRTVSAVMEGSAVVITKTLTDRWPNLGTPGVKVVERWELCDGGREMDVVVNGRRIAAYRRARLSTILLGGRP